MLVKSVLFILTRSFLPSRPWLGRVDVRQVDSPRGEEGLELLPGTRGPRVTAVVEGDGHEVSRGAAGLRRRVPVMHHVQARPRTGRELVTDLHRRVTWWKVLCYLLPW